MATRLTRQTRSDDAEAVQRGPEPQALPQPRQRGEANMLPPRMPSQRILQRRLSAPITGPGSSVGNEIIVD